MKFLPPPGPRRPLASLLLLSALLGGTTPLLRADSVERVPATAEDLASALGMDMKKFTAKFADPVYATMTLSWRQPGDELVNQLKHSSPEPAQEFTMLFTRRDYGRMQMSTGGDNAKKMKDIVEMNVKFAGTGFYYRDFNPFAKLKGRQPIQSFVKDQSFEALPLDEPIPLVIEAAAEAPDKLMTVIQTQYAVSPAFVHLSVTFSREKPEPLPQADPKAIPLPSPVPTSPITPDGPPAPAPAPAPSKAVDAPAAPGNVKPASPPASPSPAARP
ncbi:MAG: hypothetical protein JWM59_1052 [Verrucomicrobiales bacterium]|nr:hypothetical protein [Verrucomicrobiales bacterium]